VADVVAKVIANEGKAPQHSLYHVDCSIPTDLMITADPAQFAIVLNELLRNSRQALQPSGGTIGLTASIAGEFVSLEIKDHGIGFSELERIHAFDPFFSGRQAGRGLGFGLCKCWQILRQHGGRIEIESAPGQATIVRSFWPLSQ
jgi:signal transduction histidine kinase